MKSSNRYSTHENIFIFHADFDDELDAYYDIISNYDELIFSDYGNLKVALARYKDYDDDCIVDYEMFNISSVFNSSIIIDENLLKLSFGYYFNKSIKLNKKLTHLFFGHNYNQPTIINDNLKYLTLGYCFNQPIILNNNLEYLLLGNSFNQNINLPNSLIYLTLFSDLQHLINYLPNSLEKLALRYVENIELNNLPNSIKIIKFCDKYYDDFSYKKKLNNLPNSVEYINLPYGYNLKIDKIPDNLKKIKCNIDYQFINDFVNKFEIEYNQKMDLNSDVAVMKKFLEN
jgi:hypothetical protein